jgi:hypothetical protein
VEVTFMEFIPLVVLTALIKKVMDTLKYGLAGDVNAVVTQFVAWATGIGVTFVAANSDWAETMIVNGTAMGTLNGWSLALIGVNLASTAGVAWDVIKAVDNNNSAEVPNLLSRTHAPQAGPTIHD